MAKQILVCEDESNILTSISFIVKKEGFELLTAEDGEQALRLAREKKPDLMLLDVMMPKMTGYEVCQILKNNEETKDIYIVMLTAKGQEADEKEGMKAGANEYIKKPFSPRQMTEKIHEILD